jgi:2-polyprenyl-3-methyl-5-hydroxy-6-metoxy-1,4-benzoquinol methylase
MKSPMTPCPSCHSTQTDRIFRKTYRQSQWYLSRCKNCAQHFTDPIPTLRDIESFYTGNYHETLCIDGRTEAVFGRKFQGYRKWLLHYVRGGRSLDLGCATGLFPSLLQESGFQAEGLELNTATAQWGRQHYGISIRNEPFETADYLPGTFDLVTLTDVLEHTLLPPIALERVHQILRPNGFAMVTFPDIRSMESRYFQTLASITHREWLWLNCHIPLHTWEFTRQTAEAMFQRAGFAVIGFRRSHPAEFQSSPLLLALLSWPPLILKIPYLAFHFGSQMEFILQKTS